MLHPIGGDLQWVVAPVILGADIIVDGSVGTIQAAQYGFDNYAGSIAVNADNKGKPGIIDLIDVTQNLGTLSAGGPTITTGPGGNVRYIHISASSTAFRSKVFGGSQPEETTYVQGQSADITDDSGAQVHITPTQENFVDPTTGLSANNSGTLTVLTYPIASSSTGLGGLGGPQTGTGSAIIRITSTRGVQVRVSGGSAEIGEIQSTGNGPALDFDLGPDGLPNTGDENNGPDGIPNTGDEPFELDPTLTANGNKPDNGIDLRGYGRNALIDVYSITGNNFDVIRNRTPGEIVNANIGSVGLLEANNLGWARSSLVKGLATEQATVVDIPGTADVEGNTFPFNGTTNGIILHAATETQPVANQILARQSIGNVLALGRVQEISANADGHGDHGIFEGIIGNVFVKGQMREVQIGEGLMPSGTGNMSRAGLYDICDFGDQGTLGMGRIEKVTNQGLNSDIRGDIITNSGIGQIGLTDGSIIDSDIMVSQTPATDSTRTGLDVSSGLAFGTTADVIVHSPGSGNTLGNIDGITTSGRGGIIGLSTKSANLGPVNALGGFGVINSRFLILGDGRFAGNTADGYGYRGVEWFGGQSLDFVNARGNGKRLSTASFEPSVILGNTMSIDPFFGTRPNELTDLNVVLGTTAANPVKKGTSASGSIDISDIRVSRDVGSIIANTIRSAGFSIGNNVGSISTRSYTDTVSFALGKVSSVNVGGDATRTSFGVAGPVGDVHIGGSFKGSSSFQATGQNGSIHSFVTDNTLYGNVYAQEGIGTIRVGTTYGSEGTRSAKNIGLFVVGGDFASNAILQVGSRSSDANGRLSKLVIEGDFQDGGLIQLNSLGANNVILGANQGTIDFKPWDS